MAIKPGALTVYQIAHRRLHEITARDMRGEDT